MAPRGLPGWRRALELKAFGIATLQTGADMLDGKRVTWGGYLEHAAFQALWCGGDCVLDAVNYPALC